MPGMTGKPQNRERIDIPVNRYLQGRRIVNGWTFLKLFLVTYLTK